MKPDLAALAMPAQTAFFPARGWIGLAAFALAVSAVVPVLFVWVPEEHPLHLSAYSVTLIGKIMCYCVVALAMNLIWGYTGILVRLAA